MVAAGREARVLREATRLLRAGVSGRVFPGAVACVGFVERGKPTFVVSLAGKLSVDLGDVAPETAYDLASLTKAFVATTALRMVEAGELDLGVTVGEVLNDIRGITIGDVTLERLLRHRGGLEAWGGLYLDVPHDPGSAPAKRWLLSEAARRVRTDDTPAVLYSDLGYMLAGEMVARAAGTTLDRAVDRWILEPLGIDGKIVYAGARTSDARRRLVRGAAPTERCDWRGRVVRGEVHDENCSALGGISGHAGLFGTARGVASFGWAMLETFLDRGSFLPGKRLREALAADDGSRYRLGWDTKSDEGSSAGKHFGRRSFGHLGFTGTSLWIDPDQELVAVLLTNRVHPSRANEKIRGFRPAFHDGIAAALR